MKITRLRTALTDYSFLAEASFKPCFMKSIIFSRFLAALLLLSVCSCRSTQPVADYSTSEPYDSTEYAYSEDDAAIEELPGGGVYRSEDTKLFDLVHTKLDVKFNWTKRYLYGVATILVKPHFYSQTQLMLNAQGFDIEYVKLINPAGKTNLKFDYDGQKLAIQLGREYPRSENINLEIKYTAKPDELEQTGSEAISEAKGLYFINPDGTDKNKPRQIWTQGETEASSCWFPTIDSPNQKSTQEIYITIEDNFKTVSNGQLISSTKNADGTRTDYWKMDKPHAPYLFMMGIGEFAVVKDMAGNIPVDYYVEPAYEQYAKDIFGNTPEMIRFFSEKLNYPFPWNKYAQIVVRDYVSGAMENTTASVFMEDLQTDRRGLIDKNWDFIIAHELFHQWFGDLVTSESWSNLTLNEAFANYSEYLWNEYKYGVEEADYGGLNELNQYLDEAQSKQVDLIRFYYDDKEDMFDSHSYAKGGRILHMLRKYVGDEAFWKSLEFYLKANEYKDVEAHNLRLAFEEVTGEDLNWFFDQWFFDAGHPEISVAHSYENGKLNVAISQNQDLQKAPLYILPLHLDYWVDGKKQRKYIILSDSYEEFEFETKEPQAILFDGEQQLLATVDHPKSNEELINQYRLSDKFTARYNALLYLSADSANIEVARTFKAALKDPFWAIREQAVYFFDGYMGEDLNEIQNTLAQMISQDPKSTVRAAAINVLAEMDGFRYADQLIAAMKDSSYVVLGSALYAYYTLDLPNSQELVQQHESLNDPNIVLVVGSYYLQEATPNKLDWYLSKVKYMTASELYYYIQLLAQYAMNGTDEDKLRVIDVIYDKAMTHGTYYVRMTSFQILNFFSDLPGVKEKIADVRAKEKDPRVLNMYTQSGTD